MYPKKIYEWNIKWNYSIVFELSENNYLVVWYDYDMVNWEINREYYCSYTTDILPFTI